MLVQARRIRYRSNRLEIELTYSNRTGMRQEIAPNGWLTLVAPSGEQIPLMPVSAKTYKLSNNSTKTYTYKIPLDSNPRLNGLDLTRCEAIVIPIGGQ